MKKCIRLSLDKTCFQWKTVCMMVLTLAMSMIACGMMGLYQKVYDYSESSCRDVLTEDLENTGMIYVRNGGYQAEEAKEFLRSAVDNKLVTAIGCVSTFKVSRLRKLADIQSKNEKTNDDMLRWTYVDETFLRICNPKFEKVVDENENNRKDVNMKTEGETRFSLYLGYNFVEIPMGTCFYEKISEDKTYVYEVKGIFAKGERFVSPEIVNGSNAGSGNSTILLDNQVFFFGDVCPPSAFWLYSFSKEANEDDTRIALTELAEEKGLEIEFSSLKASFEYARMKSGQLKNIFERMFRMISVVALLISISVFLTYFLKNARDYGILYADGFSSRELQTACFLENAWQCMIALTLAEVVVYFLSKGFFGGTYEGHVMVNYVFWHYLMPYMVMITVLILLTISIIPMVILGSVKPITLLQGEKT